MISDSAWKQAIRDILSQRPRRSVSRQGFRPAAVLVPLRERDGACHLVLTKRSDDLEYHKGQVSFPGGAWEEADGDLAATAVREAFEEIGVRSADIEVLGALDDQVTMSSKFVVTPYVAALSHLVEFTVNHCEVKELLEVPVSALLDPASYSPVTEDDDGVLQPWGHYRYMDHRITGATAIILKQLLDLVLRPNAGAH
jgi:8-oxo-dGTP pyrophosphatase MutT (NUDIX family)